MEINKRGRTELKLYFVKNAIPTERNFADLIDAMLNQKDDGIVKPAGDPLSIEAAGGDTSKKVINFYQNFTDPKPSWVLSLNPGGKSGFNISDGEGNSRLFIDKNTGNVGINTDNPSVKLDVSGTLSVKDSITLRNQSFPSDWSVWSHYIHDGLGFWGTQGSYRSSWTWNYCRKKDEGDVKNRINVLKIGYHDQNTGLTERFKNVAGIELGDDGILFRAQENVTDNSPPPAARIIIKPDGNVGIGISGPADRLDVNGDIRIRGADIKDAGGTARITLYDNGRLDLKEDGGVVALSIDTNGKVGIGTTNPSTELEVNGDHSIAGALSFGSQGRQMINLYSTSYSIGIQNSTQYYRTGKNFAWYKGGSHNSNELNAGGGTVQMVIKNGNVGIGSVAALRRLHINASNTRNPVIIENGYANTINASTLLDSLSENSLIIGGPSGNRIYFYWKSDGKKYWASLAGDEDFPSGVGIPVRDEFIVRDEPILDGTRLGATRTP
jgi:hypothetical protein